MVLFRVSEWRLCRIRRLLSLSLVIRRIPAYAFVACLSRVPMSCVRSRVIASITRTAPFFALQVCSFVVFYTQVTLYCHTLDSVLVEIWHVHSVSFDLTASALVTRFTIATASCCNVRPDLWSEQYVTVVLVMWVR